MNRSARAGACGLISVLRGAATLTVLIVATLPLLGASRSPATAGGPDTTSAAAVPNRCAEWRRSREWSPAREIARADGRLAVAASGQAAAAFGPGVTIWRRVGSRFRRSARLSDSRRASAQVGFVGERPVVVWTERRQLHVAIGSRRGNRYDVSRFDVRSADVTFSLVAGIGRPALILWNDGFGRSLAADVRGDRIAAPQSLPDTAGLAAVDGRGGATIIAGRSVLDRVGLGQFSVSGQITLPYDYSELSLVRDDSGAAALVGRQITMPPAPMAPPATQRAVVVGASRSARGAFEAARVLSTPDANVTSPVDMAADSQGNAIAVWVERDARRWRLIARDRRRAAGWGAARVLLTSTRQPRWPSVVLNDRGDGAVVFAMACPTRTALIAVRRSRSSVWQAPEVAAAWAGFVPYGHQLGIDARGRLTELWPQRLHEGGGLGTSPWVVATRSR